MFGQNVFGLEPATVRVREVRIGRAERRAARRRAREIRTGTADVFDTDGAPADDEDTNVSLNIGVSVAAGADPVVSTADSSTPVSAPATARTPEAPYTPTADGTSASALAHAEELIALATAQMGPYTTFQQLTFAPNFPLASIADEYIIPPTYPDFLDYRAEYEPEINGSNNVDLAQIQFSPPGLPVPTPSPPSKWFYRDPKGVIHGMFPSIHFGHKTHLVPQARGKHLLCMHGIKMGFCLRIFRSGRRRTQNMSFSRTCGCSALTLPILSAPLHLPHYPKHPRLLRTFSCGPYPFFPNQNTMDRRLCSSPLEAGIVPPSSMLEVDLY